MRSVQPSRTLAECYTKALMIEHEAAARCKAFADFLEEHGKLAIAAVFRKLYRYEWQHARYLERRRAAGSPPPRLRQAEIQWLGDAPPEQVADEFVFHMMTPYDALKIALSAWERAKGLFERVFRTTDDPRVRALAGALAAGESEHVGWLSDALAKVPRRPVSEADFERLLNQ